MNGIRGLWAVITHTGSHSWPRSAWAEIRRLSIESTQWSEQALTAQRQQTLAAALLAPVLDEWHARHDHDAADCTNCRHVRQACGLLGADLPPGMTAGAPLV